MAETADAFGVVMDKWLSDTTFRNTLRADPGGTVCALGLELSPEQWTALRRQLALPDEQLQARISKGFVAN